MITNAQAAAKLLRAAAEVYREAGQNNPMLTPQMTLNWKAYEAVATLVEMDPHGEAPETSEFEQ